MATIPEARSDDDLVSRSIAGDSESYRVLVERYQSRVFALAFEIVRSKEDAEDIAQDAFVKAYLSLQEFRRDSSFYTWLYRIVYNLAIDLKRKVNRRGGPTAEFDEGTTSGIGDLQASGLVGTVDGPQDVLLRREQRTLIRKALESISEEHRAVITLREIEGLSYDEIARVVGVSVGTVMSRLHYARKKLQSVLEELSPNNPSAQGLSQVKSNQEVSKGALNSGAVSGVLRRGVNLLSGLCVVAASLSLATFLGHF